MNPLDHYENNGHKRGGDPDEIVDQLSTTIENLKKQFVPPVWSDRDDHMSISRSRHDPIHDIKNRVSTKIQNESIVSDVDDERLDTHQHQTGKREFSFFKNKTWYHSFWCRVIVAWVVVSCVISVYECWMEYKRRRERQQRQRVQPVGWKYFVCSQAIKGLVLSFIVLIIVFFSLSISTIPYSLFRCKIQ